MIKSAPTNRPISITAILSKVVKSIVNWLIINHLDNFNILNNKQCTFQKQSSTTGWLISLANHIHLMLEGHVDLNFIAFDSLAQWTLIKNSLLWSYNPIKCIKIIFVKYKN